ncbi:MAG: ATP synthase subunit I [Lautropia sp.]|nr:ATP synthase subunit I [Lautropia sp.]
MLKALALQIILVVAVAILGTPFWGVIGARDALLGGAACFIPNAFFAWRLWATQGRAARSFVFAFFLGEFIKIALTLLMLTAIVKWLTPVYWEALLLGMVAALQAPWMLALFQRHRWFNMTEDAPDQTTSSRQPHNQLSQ